MKNGKQKSQKLDFNLKRESTCASDLEKTSEFFLPLMKAAGEKERITETGKQNPRGEGMPLCGSLYPPTMLYPLSGIVWCREEVAYSLKSMCAMMDV